MDKNTVLKAAGIAVVSYGIGVVHGDRVARFALTTKLEERLQKMAPMFGRGIMTVANEAVKGNMTAEEVDARLAEEFTYIQMVANLED